MKQKIKVLHAPATVGGNAQNLSRILNTLNVSSTSLTLSQNYFQYPADIIVWSDDDGTLFREWKRLIALLKEVTCYDVVHFNFGTTIAAPQVYDELDNVSASWLKRSKRKIWAFYTQALQFIELSLLRLLKRPVFITYQGDDARQGDFCLKHFEISIATQVDLGYYSRCTDEFKRNNIKRLARYTDQIYSLNPDLLYVLPENARFIPYSHVCLDEWLPIYSQTEARPLRILHAPSNRKVKGTDLLLKALDHLKTKEYQFELLLVEGLSNAEARKIYEKADVLVDQLFAGWYGGLAVELMALGKPVLAYIREEDLGFIPLQMRQDLPVIQTTPSNIEQRLMQILDMPRIELEQLGRISRDYVERWHDPVKIAAEIKTDYEAALIRRKKTKG